MPVAINWHEELEPQADDPMARVQAVIDRQADHARRIIKAEFALARLRILYPLEREIQQRRLAAAVTMAQKLWAITWRDHA